MAKLHIGLSGYDYKEWHGEGLFYAPKVKRSQFLEDYSRQFNSLEANGTFQRMPGEPTITKWIESTGSSFVVSPKMIQNVTHFKRLNTEAIEIAKEFVKVLEPLAKAAKLGPILLQLPPNLKRDDSRLDSFLTMMPQQPWLRWAVEFRNASWQTQEVAGILHKHKAAWVAAETDGEEVNVFDTTDFLFVRLRCLTYTEDQLQKWAKTLSAHLENGKDCFVYCRHKDTVEPWNWAFRLREIIEG